MVRIINNRIFNFYYIFVCKCNNEYGSSTDAHIARYIDIDLNQYLDTGHKFNCIKNTINGIIFREIEEANNFNKKFIIKHLFYNKFIKGKRNVIDTQHLF